MQPIVHGLERQFQGRIDFLLIDVGDLRTKDVQMRLGFRRVPQFVFLNKRGERVGRYLVGMQDEETLKARLNELLKVK